MLGLMTNDEYLSIEPKTSYISINPIVGETMRYGLSQQLRMHTKTPYPDLKFQFPVRPYSNLVTTNVPAVVWF